MNIGFMIGCFISIVFWGIDREKVLNNILQKLNGRYTYKIIKVVHALLIGCMVGLIFYVEKYVILENKLLGEILGVITGIIAIDVSNADKKSIKCEGEKKYFCDTISLISRGITCGFIGPIIYVNIFGMYFALLHSMIYQYTLIHENTLINGLKNLLNVIPSMVAIICLYLLYIFRYKNIYLSFRGDFLKNMFLNPLLNVDILGAYAQGVGFYWYQQEGSAFMKAYGKFQRKIDRECVVNYISIAYAICLVVFVGSFIIVRS